MLSSSSLDTFSSFTLLYSEGVSVVVVVDVVEGGGGGLLFGGICLTGTILTTL